MSIAVALLAAAASGALPSPQVQSEIVVIGERLERDWRGRVLKTDGRLACKTVRSTGDAEIDALGCGAMLHCMSDIELRMDTLAADRALSKRERRRRMDTLVRSAVPCMDEYRAATVARLVEARNRQ